jgi:AcrR family transcriptional regulator
MAGTKGVARTPVQKRGIETRSKIIKAAMRLFNEKGYHKTNAIDIASRAGLATGTFYSYFNDKKEVLLEVIRLFYAEVSAKVLGASAGSGYTVADGRDFVRSMIRAFYKAHEIHPRLHREVSAMILLDRDVEKANQAEEKKIIAQMAFFMKQYRDLLGVEDIEAAAFVIFRASDEIIHRVKMSGTGMDGESLLTELESMLYRYLFSTR